MIPGCQFAAGFLERAGRAAEAEDRYWAVAREHHASQEAARQERFAVLLDGAYEHHGLAPEALEPILASLRARPEVVRAWLVRRILVHEPEHPLFVLGVRRKRDLGDLVWKEGCKQRDLELQEALQPTPIPGEFFILVLNHRGRAERRLFEDVEGSRILPG